MKRYLLSAFMAIVCCVGCMAQDALVIEWHNGLADIFTVTPNLHIDNETESDSVFVMEADSMLASYARADIKRIAFDDEVVLTDSVERAALVALYKATDGDNWKDNTNWCTDKPLKEWKGVICPNGHVKSLSRYSNQLTGHIPPELGNLSRLETLFFAGNQLTGPIPPELGNLLKLQSLNLSSNQLTGPIPPELGNLSKLQSLSLSNNQLAGSVPPEIGSLSDLKTLNFYNNQLTGPIPPELGNLSNLTELTITTNHLSGSIPPELGNLCNLEQLSLHGNQLTGSIPPELGNLSKLQSLNLNGNQLTGIIPKELGNLTNLKTLGLVNNNLSGSIPSELGNLQNLTSLALEGNKLTGEIPKELGNLSNLIELELYENQLTGHIPPELGNLSNLKTLNITDNQLMGSIPPELGNLSNLERLGLAGNQLTGSIPPEFGNLINLIRLNLTNNKLSGELPESLSNLTKLISYYNYVGDDSFKGIELWNNNFSGKIPSLFYNHPAWYHEWPRFLFNCPMYDLEKDVYISAPSFNVIDIDGNILNSEEIYPKNKYTAIFHWATWCGFSQALMKVVIPLYERYKDYGLDIIGLCEGEEEQTIRDYIAEKGIKWRNFISEGENTFDYFSSFQGWKGVGYPTAGTPELSLVDSNGRLVFTDCINDRYKITEFLRERLGEGNIVDAYASTDFSRDGYVETLQEATTEKDIKVVIIGDGFSDRLIDNWSYYNAMQKAEEALFATEPMKSYRDMFTVKYVTAVSKNEYIGENSHTALSCYFGEGTHVGGNDAKVFEYAKKAISEDEMDDALIIVILNEPRWAGTCNMYQPEKKNDWGSGATIAYVPNIGYNGIIEYETFETMLAHEAIGHGFAKLGDEYVTKQMEIPSNEKESYQSEAQNGWWKNVDFTSDPTKVKWSTFITDERYKDEEIGVYEGALTYESGAYRPTPKSIMTSKGTEFNAPSRMAIWYRINKLTQGEDWEGTYEDFVAFDLATRPASARARAVQVKDQMPTKRPTYRGAPPVVMQGTWKSAK